MIYDFAVIGAGASGLSFTALMEQQGYKVALIEAHSLPGGCSSYFERDGFSFDVGATTLSGFSPERPIHQLVKQLDLKLDIREIDPGIVISFKDKRICRFKNHQFWIEELQKNFPNIDHVKFWDLVSKIDQNNWKFLSTLKNIPFRAFSDIFGLSLTQIQVGISISRFLFFSVKKYLPDIDDDDYLALINEILFITSQNKLHDTPMLMGAMGLNYPSDTYYIMGGMKAFSQALASKCSNIFYRHEVRQIIPLESESGFSIQTSKEEFIAKSIISTIPIWNHKSLIQDQKFQSYCDTFLSEIDHSWSAFMVYLTIPKDTKRRSLYYQIHCDSIPHCGTKSFFVSLSHPEDEQRTRPGKQVVTISTHTKPSKWLHLSRDEYLRQKNETSEFILNHLCREFELEKEDLQNITTGSPSTFIRYTKRFNGLVGGIPHSLKRNPLQLIYNPSPIKNFYFLGDTQFPGQGIASVVLGAQNLVHYLKKVAQ